jgi:hypothetical protein
MKTETHKIKESVAPILKKMLEEKKAMQELIKNGGTLIDYVSKRNQTTKSL